MKNLITKKYIIIGAAVLVVAVAGYSIFHKGGNGATRITVKKQDIVQSVLAAGKTKAVDSVDLGFEKSGKVVATYVDVGSRVVAGQTLVLLDSSELQASLLKAQADLAEELASNASNNITVSDAYSNAKTTISDTYTKADNVVRGTIDQFFDNPGEPSLNFNPTIQNSGNNITFPVSVNDRIDINDKRREVGQILTNWESTLASLSSTNIDASLAQAETNLSSVLDLVNSVSTIIFALVPYQSTHISNINTFKSDVSAARTTINTVLSNINSAREKLNTARASETAGSSVTISAQGARILRLKADIQNIESQITKTKIFASFDGVVTKQDAKVGEIVTAGESVVSVISDKKLEIESNVSEVNIGKIIIGNPVAITFDAFPGETFSGVVSYVDPGETIVDSVVNYKVTIAIKDDVSKLKNGLTSNLNIETGKKTDVLAVPLFAVVSKSGKSYVKKVDGETVVETLVTTGIVGQDGMAEVLSGLSEGDIVEISQ